MLPAIQKRPTRPRWALVGPGLLGLGVAAAGCSDDVPRAGSIDVGASKKAAVARGVGYFNFGAKTADVAPIRTRGKGMTGQTFGPVINAQGKSRASNLLSKSPRR
jgi:hypothetical protein